MKAAFKFIMSLKVLECAAIMAYALYALGITLDRLDYIILGAAFSVACIAYLANQNTDS